jgi:two-component system NtrC family sensor kinase
MPKPFEYEEILGRITTHLRLRDLARELQAAKENLERQVEERTAELARSNEELRAIAMENACLLEAEREQRKQLEQSQAQLVRSEKLAATGRLAASLAHEINNPLQIIHNSLQLLLTLPFGPDKQQEYLQMASEEVERLVELVTRILDFARPSRRKKQPADVNDAVEKALILTAKYLQHNDITLHRDLALDLPPVAAVADELGQVFLNLVLNAVDAMPQGGTLRVSSRLSDDGRLEVTFTDSGPGIAPEHVERIFEPFFSTKEEGTGLGLNISYQVVEQYGGEITVESVIGEGATLTVWLPVMGGEVVKDGD